ncbi:ABC transporter ATP-binding protein [Tabrizicola sp. J26]|uniref:ABC transporter ATP-binding protein n=1 Tax=Alitabrizicola rongguiensis TaxID=2909234 RepID=UPI001F40A406|nr:ABC transporter ATP-binding protein [Tabrizicola rongguiensis]MCF1709404.1 ABC transporter ATP-binding protein [Tabrizicola rongguiensis]
MQDNSPAQPAVDLRGVVKRFGTMTAVDHLDLTIRSGEFFTMLGASGCGKTTTLRLIAGFELPTEGQILISGQDVSDIPAYQRPVHTVFQSYALFPHLTILDNVAFPLRVRRLPRAEQRARAMAALEMVQMGRYGDRKPSQLSGGQQQRVALARALVNEPTVLLLDEPLGALDLKLRKEMQLELKDMQRRLGITFVFVTHDQEEALTLSDRIALMQGGRIVQLDTPANLYNAPQSLYAAEFIGETNLIPARMVSADHGSSVVEALGQTYRAEGTTASAGAAVTLALRPERVRREPAGTGPVGELVEIDFIGTDLRLTYRMADGSKVIVRQQNSGGIPPAIGERMPLGFETDSLRIFTS